MIPIDQTSPEAIFKEVVEMLLQETASFNEQQPPSTEQVKVRR